MIEWRGRWRESGGGGGGEEEKVEEKRVRHSFKPFSP